jgi:hypothetical protein
METPTITTEEVTLALADPKDIVAAMRKFVPNVGPWLLDSLPRPHLCSPELGLPV